MAIHHAVSGEVMGLRPLSDPAAQTVALMRTASFETIHLVLRAGARMPGHAIAGSLSLYCVEGEALIELEDGDRPLRAGEWLYLEPKARHGVRGVGDASLLLTILFDGTSAKPG